MKDFPYPRDHHGQWFWEGGFDKDPIREAELIRDWNFRAVYGAFDAMKNGDGAAQHKTAFLTWLAYIGGPRESRRLMGDIVLKQDDIVEKVDFPDGCVPSTWSIDLHYPKQQYAEKFPDNPFISIAVHDRRIDRSYGYPVPYRCFYSRNVGNLFMAGRCISVTHEALGTTRVMRTCGMMGEVVGKAASLCVLHDCSPRDVYESHWSSMDELLKLPGKARRSSVDGEITIPSDALPLASAYGPVGRNANKGIDPKKLPGLIVDDAQAKRTGNWTAGSGLAGFIGSNYLYADKDATIRFDFALPASGKFIVSVAYQPHENRGNQVPVTLEFGKQAKKLAINMRERAPEEHGFYPIGEISGRRGERGMVLLSTDDAGGLVHADAIQVRAVATVIRLRRAHLVHALRLLILALIAVLMRLQVSERVHGVAREWELGDVQRVFPAAASFTPAGEELEVYDARGELLGYALQTSPYGDGVIGFSGPTNLVVGLTETREIDRVAIVSSADTRDHVQQVKERPEFLRALQGRAWARGLSRAMWKPLPGRR